MHFRSALIAFVAFASAGCGSSVSDFPNDPNDPTDPTDPVDPKEPESEPCTFAVGPRSGEWVTDVLLSCIEHGFPYQPTVAPTSDTTYVTADRRVAEVHGAAGTEIVPADKANSLLTDWQIAVSPDGAAYLARSFDTPGAATVLVEGLNVDAERTLEMASPEGAHVYDFKSDSSGGLNLWYYSDETMTHAVAEGGGSFSSTTTPVPDLNRLRFGLGNDGRALAVGVVWGDNATTAPDELVLIDDEGPTSYGAMTLATAVNADFHIVQPAVSASDDRDAMVAVLDDAGITVRWRDVEGNQSLALQNTANLVTSCGPFAAMNASECPETCEDVAEGVNYAAYAIARTESGDAWVAYVTTYHNVSYSDYEYICEEPSCSCSPAASVDTTTQELRLVRIPVDGEPETVLVEPITEPVTTNQDYTHHARSTVTQLHAQAFGSDLAIALGVSSTRLDAGGGYVRVMRVDTTSL